MKFRLSTGVTVCLFFSLRLRHWRFAHSCPRKITGRPATDRGHPVFAVASTAKIRHGALGALFACRCWRLLRQ